MNRCVQVGVGTTRLQIFYENPQIIGKINKVVQILRKILFVTQ